jgi:hypothetical protein
MDAIIVRQIRYYGESIDLGVVIDAVLEPLADQVLAQATQLWNGGAGLDGDIYEAIQELKRCGSVATIMNVSASLPDEPPDVAAALDRLGL